MIRFIDLGKQIGLDDEWPREFAFFDTISDTFVDIGGEQTWASWDQLVTSGDGDSSFLRRLKSLCPSWVFTAESPWMREGV